MNLEYIHIFFLNKLNHLFCHLGLTKDQDKCFFHIFLLVFRHLDKIQIRKLVFYHLNQYFYKALMWMRLRSCQMLIQ